MYISLALVFLSPQIQTRERHSTCILYVDLLDKVYDSVGNVLDKFLPLLSSILWRPLWSIKFNYAIH